MGLSQFAMVMLHQVFTHRAACPQIKWPNDLYLNNKKLAGVLVDVEQKGSNEVEVILGMGINVNAPKMCEQSIGIDDVVSGLIDRNEWLRDYISTFKHNLPMFLKSQMSHWVEYWRAHDLLDNQYCQLNYHDQFIEGWVRGINNEGQLIMQETNSDKDRLFLSGDVSKIRHRPLDEEI